jgi:hypothetical protein
LEASVSNSNGTLTANLTANSTLIGGGVAASFLGSMPSKFLIHEYFYFINFQFYVMKGDSERDFLMLYAIMAGLFFLFLIVLILISGKVFEEAKTEDVKEGTKIVLRVISILMCLYIYILQMPLVTLTLQGFLCDEDASEALVLTTIRCDSLTH